VCNNIAFCKIRPKRDDDPSSYSCHKAGKERIKMKGGIKRK